MAGSIENNCFLKLTGKLSNADKLQNTQLSNKDFVNIFDLAKNKYDADNTGTIDATEYMNSANEYYGSDEFNKKFESVEDLCNAIDEIGMFDDSDGLSYSDLSELNKLTSSNGLSSAVQKGVGMPTLDDRIASQKTARADRASNSQNVKAVDAGSLENKNLGDLKNDRTHEIQDLNDARHRAQDYEKNNPDVVNAQNNVNDLQQQLDEAIAAEAEESESEEVQQLKEQLDSVNESYEAQQEVVDGIQTELDDFDSQISELEEGVTTAEEAVTTAEEGVTTAEEGVTTAEDGVSTAEDNVASAQDGVAAAQANLDACSANEPQQSNYMKEGPDGEMQVDSEAFNAAHAAWAEQKAAAEAELQRAEQALQDAETALEEAQTALEEAQAALEEAQTALEEAQTALEEAQTALEEAQDKLAELNDQLVEAQDELTALEEEKTDLEGQIAEALQKENPDSKVAELREQLETAKSDLQSVKQEVKGELDNDIAQYEENVSQYDNVINQKEIEEQNNKAEQRLNGSDEDELSFFKNNDKLNDNVKNSINVDGDEKNVDIETWEKGNKGMNDCLSNVIANNYDLEALGIEPGSPEYKALEKAVMDANKGIYDENGNRARILDGNQNNTVLYTGDNLNLPRVTDIKDEGLQAKVDAAAKKAGKAYATTESESTYTGNTSDPTKTKIETVHNPDGTTYERKTVTHLRDGSTTVTETNDKKGTVTTVENDKDGNQTHKTETTTTVNSNDATKTSTRTTTDAKGNKTTTTTKENLKTGDKVVTQDKGNGSKVETTYNNKGEKIKENVITSKVSGDNPVRTTTQNITNANGKKQTVTTYEDLKTGNKTVVTENDNGVISSKKYDKDNNYLGDISTNKTQGGNSAKQDGSTYGMAEQEVETQPASTTAPASSSTTTGTASERSASSGNSTTTTTTTTTTATTATNGKNGNELADSGKNPSFKEISNDINELKKDINSLTNKDKLLDENFDRWYQEITANDKLSVPERIDLFKQLSDLDKDRTAELLDTKDVSYLHAIASDKDLNAKQKGDYISDIVNIKYDGDISKMSDTEVAAYIDVINGAKTSKEVAEITKAADINSLCSTIQKNFSSDTETAALQKLAAGLDKNDKELTSEDIGWGKYKNEDNLQTYTTGTQQLQRVIRDVESGKLTSKEGKYLLQQIGSRDENIEYFRSMWNYTAGEQEKHIGTLMEIYAS